MKIHVRNHFMSALQRMSVIATVSMSPKKSEMFVLAKGRFLFCSLCAEPPD